MKRLLLAVFSFLTFTAIFSQEELIENNNSFASGMDGWNSAIWSKTSVKPSATIEHDTKLGSNDNNSILIKVRKNTPKGNGKNIILKKDGIKLKKGKKYRVSFWIRSRVANDKLIVSIYSGNDTGSSKPWAAVLETELSFKGDSKWHRLTREFTAKSQFDGMDPDYKNLALVFGFDFRRGVYNIDDISLERVK